MPAIPLGATGPPASGDTGRQGPGGQGANRGLRESRRREGGGALGSRTGALLSGSQETQNSALVGAYDVRTPPPRLCHPLLRARAEPRAEATSLLRAPGRVDAHPAWARGQRGPVQRGPSQTRLRSKVKARGRPGSAGDGWGLGGPGGRAGPDHPASRPDELFTLGGPGSGAWLRDIPGIPSVSRWGGLDPLSLQALDPQADQPRAAPGPWECRPHSGLGGHEGPAALLHLGWCSHICGYLVPDQVGIGAVPEVQQRERRQLGYRP